MGRLFVIELEGPVYTCRKCHTHLGVPSDIISKNGPYEYEFSRLGSFNTFLAERKDILCVGCCSEIGIYGASDPNTYWVMRGELHGPEGSDDEF